MVIIYCTWKTSCWFDGFCSVPTSNWNPTRKAVFMRVWTTFFHLFIAAWGGRNHWRSSAWTWPARPCFTTTPRTLSGKSVVVPNIFCRTSSKTAIGRASRSGSGLCQVCLEKVPDRQLLRKCLTGSYLERAWQLATRKLSDRQILRKSLTGAILKVSDRQLLGKGLTGSYSERVWQAATRKGPDR